MNLEQVIDKVRKLLALSESSNEHEAQLAADMAAQLMYKYKIEQASLLDGSDPDIRVDTVELWDKRSVDWHSYLASGVCEVNNCGVWLKGNKRIMICGDSSSIQVANYMFHFLLGTVRRLSRAYCQDVYGTTRGTYKARMSFATGMVLRLVERLKEDKKIREDTTREECCTSLVVIDKERKAVEEWMDANLDLGKAKRSRSRRGGRAYYDGREAANRVHIRDGLNGGSGPKCLEE